MKYPEALSTTAIGSVPFSDPEEALESLKTLNIPAYPQMVKLTYWEDMFWGALEGLPALIIDEKNMRVRAKRDRENDLADFYTRFMAGERDFLKLPPVASLGFETFLARAEKDATFGPDFLKTQVVGPITFGQMVLMEDEKNALVDDPELLEAVSLALGGKAAWQARRIRALGRTPIVFIDEPGLASFGSAFSSLSKEVVITTMNSSASVVREDGPCLIGCHICGNTDWGMMMESGIDIVNFDAFEVLEQFCLYPLEIKKFLENGGLIAYGIVPAMGFSNDVKAKKLANSVFEAWKTLEKKAVPFDLLVQKSIITTACGLSTLTPELATAATEMTSLVAKELQDLVK